MCRWIMWMGSLFLDRIDYHEVAFSMRNEVAHFRDFGGAKSLVSNHFKIGRLAAEKATRVGPITNHKIDDDGIGVLNGQRYITNKN